MSPKYKLRNHGDEPTLPVARQTMDDALLGRVNRKAYREREKTACKFTGCITPVRYRSVYAPYCDLHRTADRRGQA